MPLYLRRTVARNAIVNATLCFIIGIGLALLSDTVTLEGAKLGWLAILAFGIGLFSGWQTTAKIKAGILNSISQPLSYMPLARVPGAANDKLDWQTIDDYAIQLQTRGFSKLGYYTPYPQPKQIAGVAACFANASESTIVEVQYLQVLTPAAAGINPGVSGIHFSVASIVGGNIRVTTTDHTPMASNFLIRGDNDVIACYPGIGLLALLERHENMLGTLHKRTGKTAQSGLTMERHILIQREGFRQANRRINNTNGYELARQVDWFEANPSTKWAPPASRLKAIPESSLEDLDTSQVAQGHPPILKGTAPAHPASEAPARFDDIDNQAQEFLATLEAAHDSHVDALKERAKSGANWFYWIAGLSLANAVTGALGSNWGFAIGLGIPQVLSEIASGPHAAETPVGTIGLLYAASAAITAFFAACGWFSRRPSVVAYAVGIAVFAVDSLIFLIASDWIGVAFHALALCFIWSGFSAARQLRKMRHA